MRSLFLTPFAIAVASAATLVDRQSTSTCECGYKDSTGAVWREAIVSDFTTAAGAEAVLSQNFKKFDYPEAHDDGIYEMNYNVNNVYPYNYGLGLKTSAYSGSGLVQTAGISTLRDNIKYGSFRMRATVPNVPGVCFGFFTYKHDEVPPQEADIEFLSSDQDYYQRVHHTNQPGTIDGDVDPNASKSIVIPGADFTAFHEHRLDWLPSSSKYYYDGTLKSTVSKNSPTKDSSLIVNVWSDGGPLWSRGPPTEDAIATIYYIKVRGLFQFVFDLRKHLQLALCSRRKQDTMSSLRSFDWETLPSEVVYIPIMQAHSEVRSRISGFWATFWLDTIHMTFARLRLIYPLPIPINKMTMTETTNPYNLRPFKVHVPDEEIERTKTLLRMRRLPTEPIILESQPTTEHSILGCTKRNVVFWTLTGAQWKTGNSRVHPGPQFRYFCFMAGQVVFSSISSYRTLGECPDGQQSFDVIIPSLPGVGYSTLLPKPGATVVDNARIFDTLMTKALGPTIHHVEARVSRGSAHNPSFFAPRPDDAIEDVWNGVFLDPIEPVSTLGFVMYDNPQAYLAWLGYKYIKTLEWANYLKNPTNHTWMQYTGTIHTSMAMYQHNGIQYGIEEWKKNPPNQSPFGIQHFEGEFYLAPQSWIKNHGPMIWHQSGLNLPFHFVAVRSAFKTSVSPKGNAPASLPRILVSFSQSPMSTTFAPPRPFKVNIPDEEIERLKIVLKAQRLPQEVILPGADFGMGTELSWIQKAKQELVDFDWRAAEKVLNSFDQYLVELKTQRGIHFVHQKSTHKNAIPILMLHGWGSTVSEFNKVIDPLVNPPEGEQAFHVVAPSLPGIGLYNSFFAPKPADFDIDQLPDYEKHLLELVGIFTSVGMGYFVMQSTKVSTIGLTLYDNPQGFLSYLEHAKFMDELYVVVCYSQFTNTIHTGMAMYQLNGNKYGLEAWAQNPQDQCPFGVQHFEGEFYLSPQSWIKEQGPLIWHKYHDRGGHFAAIGNPKEFVEDCREFYGKFYWEQPGVEAKSA
ncbi:glycoside hydrolase family 16 protein [Rhizoctonia solani]|uniref:Glycoside hydrolase family 16 protein n=1 Tax=Rhizoctonia solani TaxID=456999 RepID=A0A8H8P1Z7_9AGAM|nr:glycoside hydrolase family 16 protein [Rhizoctonia solani]QRW22852.1 glycoside hydrolase family 16 protein [Rhizoctonia solani]